MPRVINALALASIVMGCGLIPQPLHDSSPSGAMAHMGGAIPDGPNASPCVPQQWVTGVVVPDARGNATIREDDGDVRRLTWGPFNPAVVDWNRRYTIGGVWFNTSDDLLACGGADSVIARD